MSPFLHFSLISLAFLSTSSSTTCHYVQNPQPASANSSNILLEFKSTRFPRLCQSSLSQPSLLPPDPTSLDCIRSALSVSYDNLKTGQSMVKSILDTSEGGVPSNLNPDVTVSKDGSRGQYNTLQDAVKAAPVNPESRRRFVIYIKEGVYEETVRVPFEKRNVVFLGISDDGFMARGLTIRNTAGPDVHQAVAFRSDSDLSVIENCEFLGNQDTLFAQSLRQFYKKCRIQGNVDFVFGNSASMFQDCEILVAPRQLNTEKGANNAIAALGRTDPAQSTGLVFQNCLINGTHEYMR
ncbi:putative pectinesterase/pectinesterase inhibitor 64 [Hibiscus syriacus]|uniref:Pectinesterase/pectinesterase inhibitor 64 n=1 Tax=Hibiscus syriacus TaxID=106335 RepID=A0A6A2ZZE7_HIBSY|nr:putative pectinesterase/pectinesterase inhibitor 64 [Hibiscus syriacus]